MNVHPDLTLCVPVKGFPGYVVSFEGEVYWVDRHLYRKINQHTNHGGYKTLSLKKGKKRHTKRVHVIVWTSFIGKVPPGYQINHRLGIKADNGLMDLVTQKQNLHHSRELGFRQKPKLETKLDDMQVLTLYTLKESHKRKSLVEYSCTTIRNVEMILSGKTWKGLFNAVMPITGVYDGQRKHTYRGVRRNQKQNFIATEEVPGLRNNFQ